MDQGCTRVAWAVACARLRAIARLKLLERVSGATRSRNCNLRIRPTDPGVATLSDFESVGPDRPTRCAERGGGILGRNDCFLAVSGGFERFQAVLDRHSPTDRPRSEKIDSGPTRPTDPLFGRSDTQITLSTSRRRTEIGTVRAHDGPVRRLMACLNPHRP